MKEKIVYKKVSELKLNPKNPRKNDNAVDVVAKSIEEFGFKNPLIVDNNGVVWCGNTRLKASRKLGLDEVPCIVADDLTEEQIRKLALIDNKSSEIAEWDFDLLQDELLDLDLSDFDLDWGIAQDSYEDFNETGLDDDREKNKVIITITCEDIDKYNIIKDKLNELVKDINATMAVKMQ